MNEFRSPLTRNARALRIWVGIVLKDEVTWVPVRPSFAESEGGRFPRSLKISGGRPPQNLRCFSNFFLIRITILHFPTFSK